MTAYSRDHQNTRLILAGALILIVALAATLRFHELGLRTIQPTESEMSLIAMQASELKGYEYLPATHGPLPHFASAAAFLAGGDDDAMARVMPAIAGVLLAMLPFAFRRELGRAGTVAAALGLAVSPTLLYYSRYANSEIYLALFAFATAIAMWRYFATSERVWLYALSFAMALMFVSSEMALVIAPVFAAYLYYRVAVALRAQMDARETFEADLGDATHYDILGVSSEATTKAIRKAYRERIDAADERAERDAIAHAYGVLTSDERRAAYDRKLARAAMAVTQPDAEAGTGSRMAVAALAGVIALAWPFMRGMRGRLGLRRLPATADAFIVLVLLALPFYGPVVQKLPFVGDRGFAGQQIVYVIGGETQTPGGEVPVMMMTLGAIFAFGAIAGIAWKWHAWVICAAIFYGTTIAFFTGFFTNSGGIWTGFWGTLDYWYRPEAEVTAGPSYYYAMTLPVYEFLPLIVAGLGTAYLAFAGGMRNRIVLAGAACALAAMAWLPASAPVVGEHRLMLAMVVACAGVLALRLPDVTKFLAFWAVGAFFAFTMVPARDPWLAVHVAVPLTLLAARILNDAIAAVPVPAEARLPRPQFSVAFGPRLAQASLAAMFAVVALVSMQSGVLASWGRGDLPQLERSLAARDAGDTPVELLAPLQTAPDVREIRNAIDRAVAASDDGETTPIIVDTSYEFASSWLWYLREYEGLELRDMRKPSLVPANAIVLADSRNRTRIGGADMLLSLTYTQRWAFPHQRYSGYSARGIAAQLIDPSAWGDWTAYMRDRGDGAGELRATSGVAFFPQALEAALPVSRQSDVLSIATEPEAAP